MKAILVAMIFFGLVQGALAQDRQDLTVKQVITAQIDAFQVDDFETAFGLASPVIRRIFGSPEQFGVMVRQGFPMVWRTSGVTYLDNREANGRFYQIARVVDAQGAEFTLEYEMVKTDSGWQINGVRRLPNADVGV